MYRAGVLGVGIVAGIILATLPLPVSAHVLVTDELNQGSAILHIMPDDNPVIGAETTIYFDTQKNLLTEKSVVTLSIKKDNQPAVLVPTQIEGSLVSATYTFAHSGVYTFTYGIDGDSKRTFLYSLRVSGDEAQTHRYPWAEGILLSCGAGLLLLSILAWNNRKVIKNVSKM